MDCRTLRRGRDKRVPRRGSDIGGARSSCPMKGDGLSNIAPRTRQAGPSERKQYRRGTPVIADEARWIVKHCAADPTSGSLGEADRDCRVLARRRAQRSPRQLGPGPCALFSCRRYCGYSGWGMSAAASDGFISRSVTHDCRCLRQ
jgi:hypothetical protein